MGAAGSIAAAACHHARDACDASLAVGRAARPVCCRSVVRARTGRSSADRPGRATPRRAALPLQWSETRERPVEGAGGRRRLVVAGGRRRPRVADDVGRGAARGRSERAGLSLRALAFDADTGKRVVDVEVFRLTRLRPLNPKNSFASPTPILDGDRVYVHFGADGTAALSTTGEVLWTRALPLRVAARRRRVAGAVQRPADLQLRRQRRGRVRRRARHAHRQGAVAPRSPAAGRPGLHDAARHHRWTAAIS